MDDETHEQPRPLVEEVLKLVAQHPVQWEQAQWGDGNSHCILGQVLADQRAQWEAKPWWRKLLLNLRAKLRRTRPWVDADEYDPWEGWLD